jgi:hypothetical protein
VALLTIELRNFDFNLHQADNSVLFILINYCVLVSTGFLEAGLDQVHYAESIFGARLIQLGSLSLSDVVWQESRLGETHENSLL